MDKKKVTNLNPHIRNIVQRYSEEIFLHIPGSRVILFGSYAKGNFNKDSDIDIAVFLPSNFLDTDFIAINRLLCRICNKYDCDIQTQVFMQEELLSPMGIVEEIVQYGVDITDFSHKDLVDF